MASLAGKVISITGAASGMGKTFAKLAGSQGAKLALSDIQKKPLEDLASELRAGGIQVKATALDVQSHKDVDDWIDGTVRHYGQLDCAANVAGILPASQNFVDTTNDLWDRVLGVNLIGVMHCVRAELRVMKKGATIVNYASILGTHGTIGQCVYGISKHGVVALTKTVAREVAGQGIRINAVAPGPIATPMTQGIPSDDPQFGRDIPLGRFGQPDEVAKLTAFLLSDDSSFMHGHVTYIDGGMDVNYWEPVICAGRVWL